VKNIEKVESSKKLIALIYRSNIKVDGVKFLTDRKNPFQVGIHNRQKGVSLPPHIHRLDSLLTIKTVQEFLYVVDGKIRVTLFTEKGKKITRKTLSPGDSILIISGGHGVDFLEDARIIELKQGPYPGPSKAKHFF